MKLFLALILSLVVFTETIVPCCLWDDCGQETASDHSQEKKKSGDCSPFASCSTCVQAVLAAKTWVVSFSLPQPQLTHTAQPQYFSLSSYNQLLLQPPRC